MRGKHRPEIHPADESHGESPDGQGTGLEGMGGIKNGSPGKRNKEGNQMVTVDEVVESVTNKMIEEVFGGDDIPNWYSALSEVKKAWGKLVEAADALATASNYLKGIPEEHRIVSLIDGVENMNDAIYTQIERMGGRAV